MTPISSSPLATLPDIGERGAAILVLRILLAKQDRSVGLPPLFDQRGEGVGGEEGPAPLLKLSTAFVNPCTLNGYILKSFPIAWIVGW